MKTGIELIAEERKEQIEKHGFSYDHDKEHHFGELQKVAATLLVLDTDARVVCPDEEWGSGNNPWGLEAKLGSYGRETTIHRLKVAGALVAAALDIELSKQL